MCCRLRDKQGVIQPNTDQTAKFCELMDSFFDCLNVRSMAEGNGKRKTFLNPYVHQDESNDRFHWMTDVFLFSFEKWKENIENRTGGYSTAEWAKIFISRQTFEGIK